jgi:hypothetical protein
MIFVSCATVKIEPRGEITKIISATEAVVNYPEVNLSVGDKVKLFRVSWMMRVRKETLKMEGVITKKLGPDLYEVKFDGTSDVGDENIVRKFN